MTRNYTTGTANFVPLLPVGGKASIFRPIYPKVHHIAQICTYIFEIFRGNIPDTYK